MDHDYLKPEDYAEPRCVLCDEPYGKTPEVKSVPQQRIISKLDEYMSRKDYDGAERHLLYWLEEAALGHDLRGALLIRNELIGHYRKTGNQEKAFQNIEKALQLLKDLDFDGTISSGTTYTNAATAYQAFGENEKAMELFQKAKTVYESGRQTRPDLLGGLYNNMALACVALKQFESAYSLYDLALAKMKDVPGGELEQAITCLNMANAVEAQQGMEAGESRIYSLLDQAYDLLDHAWKPDHEDLAFSDGYYAFVCEKCAPTFSYYGYFMAAEELNRRAEFIYERT